MDTKIDPQAQKGPRGEGNGSKGQPDSSSTHGQLAQVITGDLQQPEETRSYPSKNALNRTECSLRERYFTSLPLQF